MNKTGTQGVKPYFDKTLKMARAVAGYHEPTSKELLLARHMANDGKAISEVHTALGWTCTVVYTKSKLKRFGIHPRNDCYGPRHSAYLSPKSLNKHGTINQRSFRA